MDLCRNDYPDGYEWQNKKITEDGTYYDTLKYDYCNCDKARYQITVKFHEPSDSTFNVYMCHNTSYTWPVNNTTYTTDIEGLVVTLAKANAAGCDSVCTLNLHFLPETEHKNLDTFFCDNGLVELFGEEINYPISKENRHEIHIPSSFNPNCDSIIYHVAVERRESSPPDPVYDTICYTDLPYVWNGVEYFEGGTLEQTLTNMGGCDSFCVIELFVTPKPDTIKVDSMVCVGKKFDWRDKVIDFIDEPFTYEKHYQFTQYGEQVKCDSVVFMLDADTMDCCTHLTNYKLIKPEITNQLYVCPDENSPYTMTLGYSAGLPASYTLTFDSKAIQKGFENGAQIFDDSNSPSSEYILVPVPFPSTPSVNYLRPDAYTFEIVVIDSCERPFTHILRDTIFVYYPSWITEQYLNSTFALLNDKYNKGYTFSSMQWYADGAAIGGATQSYITVHTTPLDSVAYQMYLVRSDDKYGTFTCPVYLSENTRTTPVTEGFVTVIPTKIDKTNPLVYITSNKRGTYTIYDAFGRLVQRENFANCGNGCTISIPTAPQHLLLMIVELEDGYSETFFLLVQ